MPDEKSQDFLTPGAFSSDFLMIFDSFLRFSLPDREDQQEIQFAE
jgi:hypothetical protein